MKYRMVESPQAIHKQYSPKTCKFITLISCFHLSIPEIIILQCLSNKDSVNNNKEEICTFIPVSAQVVG
jgi:hypothetical protein